MPALDRIDIHALLKRSAGLDANCHPSEFKPQAERLLALAGRYPTATSFVLFERLDLSSSHAGDNSILAVGPDNTYPDLESVYGRHLHDLPSQRQYAVAYCPIDSEVVDKLKFIVTWCDILLRR